MSPDILSEVLQAVRLRGAVFYWVEAAAPWVALSPPSREIAARVMPGAGHVMEFHLVVAGECWTGLAGGVPERAAAGDVVVFPQGDSHIFRSAPDLPAPPPNLPPEAGTGLPLVLRVGAAGQPGARFVCGYLGCDAGPFNPLLAALPRMLRIPAGEGPLGELFRLAVAETATPRPGGEALRARLAELMFVEVVRRHLLRLPPGAEGWLGGLRDPQVGRALALLHARPARRWSLELLAREVGLSRSPLQARFAALVGQPPMRYLARWRLQVAGRRIGGTMRGAPREETMPINYDQLLNYPIPEVTQTLRWQDVALYNFSVGLGQDPMDEKQLDFVYEPRLKTMPSMPVVLGSPGFWSRNEDTGIVWQQILHGEQGLILHRPLPTEGTVIGRSRITGIVDRGEGKGALMYSERAVVDAATGETLATCTSTSFLRGNGGFGGPAGPVKQPHPEPARAPDVTLDLATRPEQALVYRLNSDLNPLHIDPEIARGAGFPRPILHGLCTFGTVCHALLHALCDYDVARFGRMDLRFSSPVFPGETIRTEIWHEEGGAAFRARVVERDKVVVSNGLFRFA